jgi:hypothetical protein
VIVGLGSIKANHWIDDGRKRERKKEGKNGGSTVQHFKARAIENISVLIPSPATFC